MARKSLPASIGSARIRDRTPSSSLHKTKPQPDQSTLTQMEFATPKFNEDHIADSQEQESEWIRPRKRRRASDMSRLPPMRQNTLTQMDFVALLEDDGEALNILDLDVDDMVPELQDEMYTATKTFTIPNSTGQHIQGHSQDNLPIEKSSTEDSKENFVDLFNEELGKPVPRQDSDAITEQAEEGNEDIADEVPQIHEISVLSTPKRRIPHIVPSSQTPITTPLSIHWSSPAKNSGLESATPPSPTPSRRKQRSPIFKLPPKPPQFDLVPQTLHAPIPVSQTQTQTQTQTSPATKKRAEAFHERMKQLSRENSKSSLGSLTRENSTKSCQTQKTGEHAPPSFISFSDSFDVGEETQAALVQVEQEISSSTGSKRTKSTSRSVCQPERSFELPFADESQSEEQLNDYIAGESMSLLSQLRDDQVDGVGGDMSPIPQSSPVAASQATTAPCTPYTSERIRQSPNFFHSPARTLKFLQRPPPLHTNESDEENALPIETRQDDSIFIAGGGTVTISQLLPSSLMNSDIPLPPRWDEIDDL
jgi:hypothetical protein